MIIDRAQERHKKTHWVGFASDSRMLAQVPPLRRVVFEAIHFNGEKSRETKAAASVGENQRLRRKCAG